MKNKPLFYIIISVTIILLGGVIYPLIFEDYQGDHSFILYEPGKIQNFFLLNLAVLEWDDEISQIPVFSSEYPYELIKSYIETEVSNKSKVSLYQINNSSSLKQWILEFERGKSKHFLLFNYRETADPIFEFIIYGKMKQITKQDIIDYKNRLLIQK